MFPDPMIIHSIKWRLQAWHSFLLVCLVVGLMTGFYTFERNARLEAVDRELIETMTPLMPRFAPPGRREMMGNPRGLLPEERGPEGRGDRPPPPEEDEGPPDGPGFRDGPPQGRERVPLPITLGKIYYVAWTEQGERFAASTNAPANIERPQPPSHDGGQLLRTRGLNREFASFVPTGRSILVGRSLEPVFAELHQLALALALIGLGIVVIGFAVGWRLATRALRPIAEISQAAQEIAAGDLSKRINASETESELGKLATVLNSTFARLDAAFAQQQQFTSDAAHELRTPVSVILTQVQSTLNKERTGAEYRETLEACQRAAQRMRRLIESLLELARFDAGQEKLKRIPFDLAATARDCAELVQPLAQERRVKIITDLSTANCAGDSERIGQVITNLLTNAVNYNKPDGEVRVTATLQNGSAIVTVSDTGRGIAPEDLPRVFERFYRADQSRSNSLGSAGLGLSICKAIVEAHGGTIEVTSKPNAGATFTVRLPA
ncbi:MAG: HAMP domain-containing protein [Verrucomicrobia bacterium]|nr:MAG: HAMP domain-containing protein [Verrucomicrobiota bacterium]